MRDAIEAKRPQWEFASAASPAEAMEVLEDRTVDCVISVETLEDGPAIELLRTVREHSPRLPYVLFGKDLSIEVVRAAIEEGVTDCLPKELAETDFSLLITRIEQIVEEYRERERVRELERINTVIRNLNQELVRATSMGEIDRRVCEIISHSDPYVFAWIGERDPDSAVVSARAAAGIKSGYLEEVTIKTGESVKAKGPTGRAIETREMQVMQNIPENPAYEPWREQALERGYRSSAAVPLEYDSTFYGVLNLYADRIYAFDEEEQEILTELGETIAYAYHDLAIAEETRRFQQAVEQAADAIFITDTEGTIEYVNPAFEALTGYTAEEAIGQNPRILKSGALSEAYSEEMWGTILAGKIWKSEIVNVKRSGEEYDAEQTVAPIENADGEIEGFVAIQRDVTERKARREELEMYEQLWTNLPVGVGRLDPEQDGLFLLGNKQLAEIVGAESTKTLTGHSIGEVWQDDREIDTFLDTVREAGQASTKTAFETLAGDHIWVRITALASEISDGSVVDIVIQDITDIREKETYLEKAQEVANIGWWHKDIPDDQIYWSEQISKMWGADEDIGLLNHERFLSFVHPADREYVDEQWEAAKAGEPYDIEHRIITTDGTVKWMREKAEVTFDDAGNPVSAIGIVQDITDQKSSEQALEEQKNRYQAVIENVHEGLVIIQDEVITFVNPRVSELTGYSAEEMVGQPLTKFIVEDQLQEVLDKYHARLEGEQPKTTYRIDIRLQDGDLLPVELSVGVFEYEGKPATISAIRDISERVDRTKQLQVMDRVLRHNLRNDMTTIQGYAEIAREGTTGMDDELERIIESSRQFLRTVDKEREIVQVIADRSEPAGVAVVDVCQRVVSAVRKAHPDAEIEFEHPLGASALATEKLDRAVEELLENAIIHNDTDSPEITLRVEPLEERVQIIVIDNGPGIPEAEVNVLTRKQEVEPLYHGSGLGLSLVNWIVRRSTGTLRFEENEPRGSIVTIELQRTA